MDHLDENTSQLVNNEKMAPKSPKSSEKFSVFNSKSTEAPTLYDENDINPLVEETNNTYDASLGCNTYHANRSKNQCSRFEYDNTCNMGSPTMLKSVSGEDASLSAEPKKNFICNAERKDILKLSNTIVPAKGKRYNAKNNNQFIRASMPHKQFILSDLFAYWIL